MWFDWDSRKAVRNLAKHRVPFQEAATVFRDPFSWSYPNEAHSVQERRFLTIGISEHQRVLVVAHVDSTAACRIISARRATRSERIFYEEKR